MPLSVQKAREIVKETQKAIDSERQASSVYCYAELDWWLSAQSLSDHFENSPHDENTLKHALSIIYQESDVDYDCGQSSCGFCKDYRIIKALSKEIGGDRDC